LVRVLLDFVRDFDFVVTVFGRRLELVEVADFVVAERVVLPRDGALAAGGAAPWGFVLVRSFTMVAGPCFGRGFGCGFAVGSGTTSGALVCFTLGASNALASGVTALVTGGDASGAEEAFRSAAASGFDSASGGDGTVGSDSTSAGSGHSSRTIARKTTDSPPMAQGITERGIRKSSSRQRGSARDDFSRTSGDRTALCLSAIRPRTAPLPWAAGRTALDADAFSLRLWAATGRDSDDADTLFFRRGAAAGRAPVDADDLSLRLGTAASRSALDADDFSL
jgi:hypothetical protein